MVFIICVLIIMVLYSAVFPETVDCTGRGEGLAKGLVDDSIETERVEREQSNRKKTIVISFAGDCTIGTDENFPYEGSFTHRLVTENNDFGYFFSNVLPVFEKDDLTLVNLETTLTRSKFRIPKKFNFKGDPSYTGILKAGSIEMVNISNNHIYDYGREGFMDTLAALRRAEIQVCGESNIAFYRAKGITIACMGYTGWDDSVMEHVERDIDYARSRADLVVVSFHWGTERSNYPNSLQIRLGRFCVDRGADIVVGHHPHVIQGIEKYRDRYIVYSLGNFCFGGNRNPSDKDTFIFQNYFTLVDGKVVSSEERIIPCSVSSVPHANDYRPTILEGTDGERVLSRIYKYSDRLEHGISG
jgi:poly-gamma-glutamate synthesis protein (capsule biosynthesis protein)